MAHESIWRCLANRCRHGLASPEAGCTRSGLVFVVAVTGIMVGSESGIAEERPDAESLAPIEHGSTDAPATSHLSAAPTVERAAGALRTGDPQPYWVTALQRPITSDGRGALAARVGTLIREGDPTRAKELLSATIETGTLAFMILLHFDDKALHARLQELATNGQNALVAAPPPESADEHLTALETSKARAAELAAALEQEKGRSASIMRDLETARKQLAGMNESLENVAALKDDAAREKGRAEAALLELVQVRQQLTALEGRTIELETMLTLENERSVSVTRERESLKQQLTAMQLARAKTAELEDAVVQEKQRADATLQQLDSLQDKLSALSKENAERKDEIDREKERGAFLTQQLEAAQGEIATLKSHLDNLDGVNETLRQEKEETAVTLRDLQLVNGQLAALGRAAKSDIPERRLRSRQLTTSPVRGKAISRLQHGRNYGRVRRGGIWTGLMGGYGNARGSRTNNGPGIW